MEEGSNSNSNSNSNKGDDDHHNHLDHHHHLLLVDDLLIQILVCLPVISLLRFKTVCKSWRAIIESSDFIHLHATTTTINNNNDSDSVGPLIFQHFPLFAARNNSRWTPHFFVLSGTANKNGCYQEWLYKDLGFLEESRDDCPPMMVASCHGIICLHYRVPRDIALWNPATKQYRILPKSLPLPLDFGRPIDDNDFVGFGFDTQTKDYKVLLITCFESDDYSETKKKNAIQVYTVRTNSWRWCPHVDLPTHNRAYPPNQGFYRNGHYFFLAAQVYKTSDYDDDGDVGVKEVMISFDFSKETYRIIPIPNDGNIRLDIRRRDGKIVCVTALQSDDRKCQVYVLNDDVDDDTTPRNDEYSWTKLYETYLYQPRSSVGPMAISKDGLCGILRGSDAHGLMSYNFKTEEGKDIQIANVSFTDLYVERVQVYKESLVSIYPPHHDDTTTF